MNTKTLIQDIYEAAVAARAIPAVAQMGRAAATAAGTAIGNAVANKVMPQDEGAVTGVSTQGAPQTNAGGAQNLQPNPQTATGTPQEIGAVQQPVAPKPGDVNFDNSKIVPQNPQQAQQAQAQVKVSPEEIEAQKEIQSQQANQELTPQEKQAQAAAMVRDLVGVNEAGFVSGITRKVFRRG